MFVSNSEAHPNGDGTAWANGDYSFKWPGGTDKGVLLMLQSFRADNPPTLNRDWVGTFMAGDQRGSVRVMINAQDGSGFAGMAWLGDMQFPFFGTVSDTMEKEGNIIHAIGHTPAVQFIISGDWFESRGTIEADFTATFADGSVLKGSFSLSPAKEPPTD